MQPDVKERLLKVLAHPLTSEIELLRHVCDTLGGPAILHGEGSRLPYVWCPGTRADRVVICAHADTVWSQANGGAYGSGVLPVLVEDDGVVHSGRAPFGIGADDRAGVAMALELADLGHSILIVTGEEPGSLCCRQLRNSTAPEDIALFNEINAHNFIAELDRCGDNDFKCYDVGTDEFRAFISSETGFAEPNRNSGTDISVLCRDICGVNFSVGYYDEHTAAEHLVLEEYASVLERLRIFFAKELPKFPYTRPPEPVYERRGMLSGGMLRLMHCGFSDSPLDAVVARDPDFRAYLDAHPKTEERLRLFLGELF